MITTKFNSFLCVTIWNFISFQILTRLIAEFDHNIPNVDLTSLHSIGDALAFFNKPVKDTSKYEDLAKLDLPPNVHIQLEALRFDPATDTMFGGISAFPDRLTIVKSIRYRKKYGKNDWYKKSLNIYIDGNVLYVATALYWVIHQRNMFLY